MISRVVASERQRLVPQPSSFTRAQQNGHFTACRVIGFTGGCPNAGPEQWSGHRGGLQIIGCSLFNWNVCGARLAHEASGRRIFGPARCLRRRRTAGEQRETRCGGDEANPDRCFRTFRIHEI